LNRSHIQYLCARYCPVKIKKVSVLNDPIYGFIPIETELIQKVVDHPIFQRLRRISQMGLSNLVYPGAHHNRFEHALGALFLMQKAVGVLRKKGVSISPAEREAMQLAMLLHDLGHGPFSHAMEHFLLADKSHEQLSVILMEQLNSAFDGRLDLALSIFQNNYSRKFMHQLICGQVDLDRMDYLKRDSFYTGVTEGNINGERIIAMMNVVDDQLVFEEKGCYSLEKFLLARRLMYWQVYLHKTSLAAELLLVKCLERARQIYQTQPQETVISKPLHYFLSLAQPPATWDQKALDYFIRLDDTDILQALKNWQEHTDPLLRWLSRAINQRQLPKIKLADQPFTATDIRKKQKQLSASVFSPEEIETMVFKGSIANQAYHIENTPIRLLTKSKKLMPLHEHPAFGMIRNYSAKQQAHYLCYPRGKHST